MSRYKTAPTSYNQSSLGVDRGRGLSERSFRAGPTTRLLLKLSVTISFSMQSNLCMSTKDRFFLKNSSLFLKAEFIN